MIAGLDTTLTMTEFALFMLGKEPELQERLYYELKQNYNAHKISSVNNCPMFKAYIDECMRRSNIGTFAVPRYTTKTIKVKVNDNIEYNIPKNCIVFASFPTIMGYWEYNRGKYEIWIKPETFNIHNFLDSNGKYKKNDSMILFSAGKRDCIGKSLAYKLRMYKHLIVIFIPYI